MAVYLRIGANRSYLDKLQRLMNISLRCCLKKSYDTSVFLMHVEAKVLPLDIRRNVSLLKLMYNCANKVAFEGNVLRVDKGVNTRSTKYKNFMMSRPKYEWYKMSVVYQGKKRWMELPVDLKKASNIKEFSNKITQYYVREFVATGIVR